MGSLSGRAGVFKRRGRNAESCFLCVNAEEMPPREDKGTSTVYKLEIPPESNPDDTWILDFFSRTVKK